jgi:hypothetical protein
LNEDGEVEYSSLSQGSEDTEGLREVDEFGMNE